MDRTGIVRRMDELGRIVIPKEIRRVMRLAEGEEMEIFPEGDQFVVRKHSRFSALGRTVDAVVGLLAEHTGCEVFLAAAGVVTAAGGRMRKALLARPLAEGFAARFRGRERVCVKGEIGLSPVEGTDVGGARRVCGGASGRAVRRVRRDVSERRGRLAGGAAVLALGSVVAKLIGAFHRVPLTNILGAGGMGVYQLVFPVYALFITLSTAGIPTALSRLVAEHRARGEDARKYLAAALFTLIALSVLAGVLIVALSHVLARWQGNPAAAGGYVVIAPAVVFSGIVAGLRGWFQGEMRMAPTALSAVIEQLVKLGVGVGLAALFAPRGMTAAVLGALAGVTASEAVAAAYLFIVRAVERRRGEGARGTLRLDAVERGAMFRTAAPIALLSVIIPLGAFSDTFIVVNALKWGGADTAAATGDGARRRRRPLRLRFAGGSGPRRRPRKEQDVRQARLSRRGSVRALPHGLRQEYPLRPLSHSRCLRG